MAPTVASFAELSSRMPVSAGEAAYVRKGLNSRLLVIVLVLSLVFPIAGLADRRLKRHVYWTAMLI